MRHIQTGGIALAVRSIEFPALSGLIRLRDLPGVEQLDWAVEETGQWTRELENQAHTLAKHLFGISVHDTDDIHGDDGEFSVLNMMRDEADAYWASHGWDVTDGRGKELRVMEYLIVPLVCVVEKLHPDAQFAGGKDAWAVRLEEEARRFKPSR